MKKILTLALLGLMGLTASAATIQGFALVVDGVPNSEANDLSYLNQAITLRNSNPLTGTIGDELYYRMDGPVGAAALAASTGRFRIVTPLSATVELNGTAEYIVAHWGGQYGGADIMYYLGTGQPGNFLSGPVDLSRANLPAGISLGGISSITMFGANVTADSGTTVPDGGATLALFGASMCGLYTVGRIKKKA